MKNLRVFPSICRHTRSLQLSFATHWLGCHATRIIQGLLGHTTFAFDKSIFGLHTPYSIDFQNYKKIALKWIYETYKNGIYAMRIFR